MRKRGRHIRKLKVLRDRLRVDQLVQEDLKEMEGYILEYHEEASRFSTERMQMEKIPGAQKWNII